MTKTCTISSSKFPQLDVFWSCMSSKIGSLFPCIQCIVESIRYHLQCLLSRFSFTNIPFKYPFSLARTYWIKVIDGIPGAVLGSCHTWRMLIVAWSVVPWLEARMCVHHSACWYGNSGDPPSSLAMSCRNEGLPPFNTYTRGIAKFTWLWWRDVINASLFRICAKAANWAKHFRHFPANRRQNSQNFGKLKLETIFKCDGLLVDGG